MYFGLFQEILGTNYKFLVRTDTDTRDGLLNFIAIQKPLKSFAMKYKNIKVVTFNA